MKNLLERMKAEPLAKLNEVKKIYPQTFKIVENELINNHTIYGLKYDTVTDLKINGISKSCEIHDIQNLFNHE